MNTVFIILLTLTIGTNMTLASESVLRISFPNNKKEILINEFDPAKIDFIHQWDMALNLYSRLISFNSKGELVSGLAKKFYWVGDTAHLEIRNDFQTIDGYKITPDDVAFSLKRLIKLNSNSHGKLENIVCDFTRTDDIEKNCTGISVQNNEVLINTKHKDLFLFKTLTSADFSIIRQKSVNKDSLKIEDYRNTSGPYYYSGANEKGHIILKANPFHWNYSKSIPQEIEIITDLFGQKDNGKSVTTKMLDGELDAISISNTVLATDFDALKKEFDSRKIKYSFFETAPFILTFFKFTATGLELNNELRFSIVKDIQSALRRNAEGLKKQARSITPFIFQPNTHGGLSKDQEKKYLDLLSQPISLKTPKKKITIAVIERNKELFEKILKNTYFDYTLVSYPSQKDFPENKKSTKELPYLMLGNQDVIFEEDVNLLSFAFSASDIFCLKGQSSDNWLNKFRQEDNAQKRMDMVKNLHFDSLATSPSVIPLYTTSLRAIATGPWKLHFTKTAETPFWLIKREE